MAEQPIASIASKYKWLRKYKLLRKHGLSSIKAVATRKDFKPESHCNPDLLKLVENMKKLEKLKKKPEYEKELEKHEKKLEEYENKFAEKIDDALKKFLASGLTHHDFFFKTKPTTEEFFHLLVLREKLSSKRVEILEGIRASRRHPVFARKLGFMESETRCENPLQPRFESRK